MSQISEPILSALLLAVDNGARLKTTLDHLAAQTICSQIELVLISSQPDQLTLSAAQLRPFHSVRYASMRQDFTVAQGYAAGVEAATAPVVAFCEDHSYPQPGWGAALAAAYGDKVAAVGAVIRNHNPDSLVSWADHFVCHGSWAEPSLSGERDSLPHHNSSYRRHLLLSFGARLTDLLTAERLLHALLRAQGYQVYLEAGAVTSHANFTSLRAWMIKQYYAGRSFAAQRCLGWERSRRWLYVAGGPLIPIIQLRRVWQEARRPGRYPANASRLVPAIFCGLAAHAAGEVLGYGWGLGTTDQKLTDYELRQTKRG